MICSYVIGIFNKNINMLLAVILDNETGSRKLQVKIDHVVNNLFYFIIFWTCLQNKIAKKEIKAFISNLDLLLANCLEESIFWKKFLL